MRSFIHAVFVAGLLSLVGCSSVTKTGGGGTTAPVLQSIAVTPATSTLAIGSAPLQFKATGTYSSGPTQDLTSSVTWSSSTTATATISAGGLATAVKFGTTTITAASGSISGTATITVPAPLTAIAVNPASIQIAATTATSFTATGTYADGTTQNITSTVNWSSSTPSVASIRNTFPTEGTALGVAAGTTTITATCTSPCSGITGTAILTVSSATVTSIAVTPINQSIPLGVLQQFTATGTFSDSTTQDITSTVKWASSNTGVASITVSGLATGVNLGTSTISATSGAVSGNTSLTVNAANLASLAITPANPSMALNTSLRLIATGTFNDGGTRNLTNQVTWTSSVPATATVVSNTGVAKGVAAGTTTITAALGSVTTTATLTVTTATVTSITVTPLSKTIAPGTKLSFAATGKFSDSSSQVLTSDVVWASDNTAFATIIPAGTATAVAAGTANITAAFGGVTGTAPLIVSGATLSSIAVTPSTAVLAPASTLAYQAIGTYSDSSTQNITGSVTWSSSMTNVVSISGGGLATGQSAGQATIQAQVGTVSGTAQIVVEASALQSITVTTTGTASIPVQVEQQYTAIATFADKSTQNLTQSVTWASSNSSVATVGDTAGTLGLATGVAPGTSNLTATFGGVSGFTTVTVSNATLSSITVTPTGASVKVGATQQLIATGNYTDGPHDLTNQAAWASSDVSIAVISNIGLASGAKAGSVTITAGMGGATGTDTLTVTP